MGSIRPRRLSIKNFRSFLHEATFEFPERGLVLVRGWNEDADDSSGAGKSSFNEALAFANDISQFPATEHQCWHTEEPFQVTYEFDSPAGTVVRKLGKTASLKVGDESLTASKAIKERMGKLVGLSPEMLKALVYRPQREPGLFLTMTDGKKKEFLTELLGLSQFEKEAEKAQKRVTALETEVETKLALCRAAEAAVPARPTFAPQDVDESGLGLLRMKLGMVESALPVLEAQYDKANEEFLSLVRAHEEEAQKAMAPVIAERDAFTGRQTVSIPTEILENEKKVMSRLKLIDERIAEAKGEWRATEARYEETVVGFRKGLIEARKKAVPKEEYQRQLRQVEANITALQSMKCPTCEREWVTGQKKLAELVAESEELAQRIERCLRAEDEADGLQKSATSWEAALANHRGSSLVPQELLDVREKLVSSLGSISQQKNDAIHIAGAERKLKFAEFEKRLDAISAVCRQQQDDATARVTPLLNRMSVEMAKLKGDISSLKAQAQAEERRLNDIREANRRGRAQYDAAMKVWAAAKDRVEVAYAEKGKAEDALDEEKDFLKLVGREGFLGVIFDDVLNAIATETNDILANVPNVAHVTLQFQSERETQEGKLRKEIRPVLYANGRQVSLKSLSGGMQVAVELAVDIALGNVVSQRTGVFPGWLVLDEPFDGLGINVKRACLDILKKAAQDRLILVVDHSTEVREGFDTTIDIRLRDGLSVVS